MPKRERDGKVTCSGDDEDERLTDKNETKKIRDRERSSIYYGKHSVEIAEKRQHKKIREALAHIHGRGIHQPGLG